MDQLEGASFFMRRKTGSESRLDCKLVDRLLVAEELGHVCFADD